MKKRLVSILLVLVMVLGMLPTVALAAEETPKSIKTAEDFANMEPGGNYRLDADIPEIITAAYENFSGTFDGNGHTITLKIERAGYAGLFTSLQGMSGGTTVKNLIVKGSVDGGEDTDYAGGIASMANTMNGPVTIENCRNEATIKGKRYVGGILGGANKSTAVTVRGCSNTGSVTGSSKWAGGIVGYMSNGSHVIENCYNTGAIAASSNAAGILGWAAEGASLKNCYTVGTVEPSTNAIVNSYSGKGTVTNCYALQGMATNLLTGITKDDASDFMDEADMKKAEFAALLGDGFMAKTGSFPILKWETPTAPKTFHITPATATLTIKNGDDAVYSGTGAEQTVALAAGTYTYTVSCAGYVTKNGDAFEVTAAQAEAGKELEPVTVALDVNADAWVTLTVTKNPASTVVTIKDADGNVVAPEGNGSYKLLKDGTYTYSAKTEAEGYEDAEGSVDRASGKLDIVLLQVRDIAITSPATKTTYFQGEALDTTGLVLTVYYTNNTSVEIPAAEFEDKGIKPQFSSSQASEAATVTIPYKGKSATYQVVVKEKPMPNAIFDGLKGYATVEFSSSTDSIPAKDAYVDAVVDGETVLRSNSKGKNSSQVTITIKFGDNLPSDTFIFDWKASSETRFDYLSINGSTDKSLSGSTDWTTKKLTVKSGDTLTLTFIKDSSGEKFDDCVYLRNFGFAFDVTFDVTPKDAQITLVNKKTNGKITGTNGVFTVIPGEYTYTVSKFGYAPQSDSFTVSSENVTKKVTLEEGKPQKVTFRLTLPEKLTGEYTLTVQSGSDYSETKTFTASPVELELVAGSYTYTITHPNCDETKGSLTVGAAPVVEENTVIRKLVFADFFADCEGVTADQGYGEAWTPVKDEAGNYLKSTTTANRRNYLNIKTEKNVILSFDVLPYVYSSSYTLTIKKAASASASGTPIKTFAQSSAWQNYSVSLKAGEVLKLEYNTTSGWNASNYYLYLRNFQTIQTSKVEFTGVTEGAALTVTDKDGKTYEPESGATYYLPAGNYTYTVSKFGWGTHSASFEVKAGEEQTIEVPALSQLESRTITFDVKPEGATVTVTHAAAGEQKPNEDGTYTLVEGETYTYTVSKTDYLTKSGTITVSKDETITVTLTYAGKSWDGSTEEPNKSADGTYQISNAAELAWFAAKVNGGEAAINAELTDNINLNGKTWTAIKSYAGTFDGGKYLVSGLVGESGLFDSIAAAGTVKNLNVSGTLSNSEKWGRVVIGILANISDGTIENCFTSGSASKINSSGAMGGLVGMANAGSVIRGSGSSAAVSCVITSINQKLLNIGGLVGGLYGTVENSYAIGNVMSSPEVSGNGYVGGLVGHVEKSGVINNSYAAGTVNGSAGGFGAFAGTNSGSITKGFYREGAAAAAVASGSTSGTRALAESYMKSEDFIKKELGLEIFNKDTDVINGGYPILPWQGGRKVELTQDDQDATYDAQHAKLYDKTLASTVNDMRAQAAEEVDEMLADLSLSEINAYIQENFGYNDKVIRSYDEAREIFLTFYYEQLEMDYQEAYGVEIDLDNTTGLLTPDNDGVYHITDSNTVLEFGKTGERGSAITWTSNSADLNAATGAVKLPASGTTTVTLTAAANLNGATASHDITVILTSSQAASGDELAEIKAKLEDTYTYIQPVQIRGHENVTDAVSFWLYENGYEREGVDEEGSRIYFDKDGNRLSKDEVKAAIQNGDKLYRAPTEITVTLKDPGTLGTYGVSDHSYLANDGAVTYYQGEGDKDTKYVIYSGVKFELTKDGATQEVTTKVRIGWDIEKAQELMRKALDEKLRWEDIRGENTNTASASTIKDFAGMVVGGQISEKLSIPQTVTVDGVSIKTGCVSLPDSAVRYSSTDETIEVTPVRPERGEKATTFDFQVVTLFDQNLDDYTLEAMKNRTDDTLSALQLHNAFRITVKPETESTSSKISANLKNILPGMIVNYYDYGAPVDLTQPVKDNLKLPRLYEMEDAGIFDDYSSKMQNFVSLTPNVADINGYNIVVYRPLPGQPDATAKIKIQICERTYDENGRSVLGKVLGETTLTFKVKALDQDEINEAKALLDEVTTEQFYWNAIKGENTDKDDITSNFDPFYKVVKNEDGTFSYLKSGEPKNVEGIYTDDYPGYDPMSHYGETYRTYYSSEHEIISYESLRLLTQPEYNTKIEIKSWLTYTQYAKYYEKFILNADKANNDYAQFATFYKHVVSTTVTVKGTKGIENPDKPSTDPIQVKNVKLTIDGKGATDEVTGKVFTNAEYTFNGEHNGDGITVADVMKDFFSKTQYSSGADVTQYGGYIYSITDPNGVTLEAATDARPNAGWMYTLTGVEFADSINKEFVKSGDEIYFYYSLDYRLDDEHSEVYQKYLMLVQDVEAKINAIPKDITDENAEKFEKAVTVARNAYNDLDGAIREKMLDKDVEAKLFAAEQKLADYKAPQDTAKVEAVRALINALPNASRLTSNDREQVTTAYNAFLALTQEQKAQLTEAERQKIRDCMEVIRSLHSDEVDADRLAKVLANIEDVTDVKQTEAGYVAEAAEVYNGLGKSAQKAAKALYTQLKTAQKSLTKNQKAADKFRTTMEKKLPAAPTALTFKTIKNVTAVETAYAKLSTGAKSFVVDDYAKLTPYIEQKAKLEAGQEAVNNVIAMIKALPKASKISLDSEPAIQNAREAYDALGDLKGSVTNLKTLESAEKALADLKEFEDEAKTVKALIEAIPAVDELRYDHDTKNLEDSDDKKIEAARAAYDALAAKGKVAKSCIDKDTLNTLKTAEKAMKKLVSTDTKDIKAAEKVVQRIAKLPTDDEADLTLAKNKKAIESAKTAYLKLSPNAKQYAADVRDDVNYVERLYYCCVAAGISTDGIELNHEILALEQETAAYEAAILIEREVQAEIETEDETSVEEDAEDDLDEEANAFENIDE